jgi:superfamily II DNA or RNA helicase
MSALEKGSEYEKYVFNIIKNNYTNIWLWQDIPNDVLLTLKFINQDNENCDDIGCDILAFHNDIYYFIQCKNYSTTGIDNVINICDLSGFYNLIAELANGDIKFKAIVYYSGYLSSQVIKRKRNIEYYNIPFNKNLTNINYIPREYQIKAYNKIKESKRSILALPCGTGKTYISYLYSLDFDNIIILTPLIATTEQIYKHYKNYYSNNENINYILLNCKAKRKIIKEDLKNKNIICSTYDSSIIINKIIKNIDLNKTLIVIDEFHNLSDNMINDQKEEMNKLLKLESNYLFISARPLNINNEIFGNNKYLMDWNYAIENKLICDYKFYYPNNDEIINWIKNTKCDFNFVQKTILINKAIFLLESIKLTKVNKCIVYLKTIEESEEFQKILELISIYFEIKPRLFNITYNTSSKKRENDLIKFRNSDYKDINILCNVHIFDEGIDIPECDSIYLTHPNNNIENLIQRISRANRKDINNQDKVARVFVWAKTMKK